ncbi:DUF2076 domain-containing protein [Bradyrhizobium sp. WSM 1738]|uniref:DUF2076 domain-containing protein n=1 Tax=Bradyrhizobium hereditatis TaxID=2821405 RepID=UPI001CE24920|nr:DUF2076 domain-containing protein [Bradyrhizobium hereditatis]MCA6114850.1 DUF2076 domain-containing protein [Bradyrhizobium hereditatis]
MTPQERQLIDDLFDRLAKLESAKRDPEAMSAIMEGMRKAPNAVYALVQTTLVQDEALKRADMRIQELEAAVDQQNQQTQPGGFLDSMRDAIFGQNQQHGQAQGSVPNVRPPEIGGNRPAWNTGQVLQQTQPGGPYNQPGYGQPYGGAQQQPSAFGGGGSFLGTAAAAAAGVVGGSLLANSIRSMMGGGGNHQAFGDTAGHSGGVEDRRPWGDQSGGDLAREAGINDIGSSSRRADNNSDNDYGSRQGFFDQGSHDDGDDMDHDSDDFGGDDGDSDYA